MRNWAPRLLALVTLAFLGALLVIVPPWLVEQADRLRRAGVSATWIRVYFGLVLTGGLLALGAAASVLWRLWRNSRRRAQRKQQDRKAPSELSPEAKAAQIDRNLAEAHALRDSEALSEAERRQLEAMVAAVETKRQARRLEIVVFGTVSSGKSAVLNALAGREVFRTDVEAGTTVRRNEITWSGDDRVVLVDTPGLAEVDGAEHQRMATEAAQNADLVLLVVDGPLRAYEKELVETLAAMEKKLLVCLNKTDWYDEAQQQRLLQQLSEQLAPYVAPRDILPVQACPVERRRVRCMADGREVEETVEEPADVSPLAKRMLEVLRHEGDELLLANLLLQSRALVSEAKRQVKATLEQEAWRVVDRHMWAAGSAAALSPLPVLDLAAGSAITAKMVVEIARVYQRDFDLQAATELLAQLGKNLVAILGVSAATPAITSAVAGLLKTIPGAGTIAGGLLQGLVQVVVTRWAGAVFIRYLSAEMDEQAESLPDLARREWQRLTQPSELAKLVQMAARPWQQRGATAPQKESHDE
ncbi:MAG TPA: DUF697 domain-containing protein [Planctomycetaceae bacterium]|nr:DUF697 domain-containing protein [Planctomycetaceae bacterium]